MNLATVGTGNAVHVAIIPAAGSLARPDTACGAAARTGNVVRGTSAMHMAEGPVQEVTCKRCMRSEAYAAAEAAEAPAAEAEELPAAQLPGFICKTCDGVAPAGIGYTDNEMTTASLADSQQVTVCPCGASQQQALFNTPAVPSPVEQARAAHSEAKETRMSFTRKTAEAYEALAQQCRDERARSWEDCDTDGYLSQWANQETAARYEGLAAVARNGWMLQERALFDLEGRLIPAVEREGQYGLYWAILDPANPSGRFIGFFTESAAQKPETARKNNAKKGYYVGEVLVPAEEDQKTGRAVPLVQVWQEGVKITDNGQ